MREQDGQNDGDIGMRRHTLGLGRLVLGCTLGLGLGSILALGRKLSRLQRALLDLGESILNLRRYL